MPELSNYANTLGMRTSNTFSTDRKPGNWREGILYDEPNGDWKMTGLSSQFPKESLEGDTTFNWWTESAPRRKGTITGVYTDEALSAAYASGGVAGQSLFLKMSEADAKECLIGQTLLLRCATDVTVDCHAWITSGPKFNGASSAVGIKLLEADDNSLTKDLSDATSFKIIGTAFAEAAGPPQMIDTEPIKIYNQSQIFQTSFKISRTTKKITLRGTRNVYAEKLEKARKRHFTDIETALIWGKYYTLFEGTDEEVRFTWGLIPFIEEYGLGTYDYRTDTDYTGLTWTEGGWRWLKKVLKEVFMYGGNQRVSMSGLGAVLGLVELSELYGQLQINNGTNKLGMEAVEIVLPFGKVVSMTHALFSHDDLDSNAMVLFEPKNIKQRIVDDTMLKKDNPKAGGQMSIDGTVEVFITELGFEFHQVAGWAILRGVGLDNTLS